VRQQPTAFSEIDNHQTTTWFENDAPRPVPCVSGRRQMMHHQAAEGGVDTPSGGGSASRSARLGSRSAHGGGPLCDAAMRSSRPDGSMPDTRPASPTRVRAARATAPVPQPTSRTLSPGLSSARSTVRCRMTRERPSVSSVTTRS
jgi:hypothetical protein